MIGFICGLITGSLVTVVTMCVFFVSKEKEEE